MAIDSCTSCSSSNLATQYAQRLSEQSRTLLPAGGSESTSVRAETPLDGPILNAAGEAIGTLINTSA